MKEILPRRLLARPSVRVFLGSAALTAAIIAACSSTGIAPQQGAHVVFTCKADGMSCDQDEQCCGARCTAGMVCAPRKDGGCVENNFACSSASDCCTNDCDPDGFCGLPSCTADGDPCDGTTPPCCSHQGCVNGACAAPPDGGACVEDYNPCGDPPGPCCSTAACDSVGYCGPKDAGARCLDDLISCRSHADCCSSFCNPANAQCGFPPLATACFTANSACATGAECCSGVCQADGGICGAFVCAADGGACDAGACCDGLRCAGSACAPCIGPRNNNAGLPCQSDLDCCSLICSHGSCSAI